VTVRSAGVRWLDEDLGPARRHEQEGSAPGSRPIVDLRYRLGATGPREVEEAPGAQALLIAFDPDSPPLRVHFHTVDQFQYFTDGHGRLGGHDVAAGSLHYADAFTPYGPIEFGPQGATFWTLRADPQFGANYMPESRDELGRRLESSARPAPDRRNVSFDLKAVTVGMPGTWQPVAGDTDGMAVDVMDVPAGEEVPAPARRGYVLVVGGTLDAHGIERSEGEAAWWEPTDAPATVGTAVTPARVALLAFPGR
jgi:hypothetical protein